MDTSPHISRVPQSNSAPAATSSQRTEILARCLGAQFGLGDCATFESRFPVHELPLEDAKALVLHFRQKGWSVDVRREEADVVLEFSNPPPGSITLSASHTKALQTLLARINRFIAPGMPGGTKSYPLVERLPYRVIAVAAEVLRAQGLAVTVSLGSQSRPKAIIVEIPDKDGSRIPPQA